MSDKKISELTEETTLADTDEFVFARSGVNYKVKKSNLASSGSGHKHSRASGEEITITTDYCYIVSPRFTIDGSLITDGDLVLF